MGDHRAFWESRWASKSLSAELTRRRSGDLDEFEYPFSRYLPRDKPILEAGCGMSGYVRALQSRGYQIEGIDYAEEIVSRVKETDPELNVRIGNVLNIDRPDGYYGGYISIGVVEHFFEGPGPALREARRVLGEGGVALISVPHLNRARRRTWRGVTDATDPVIEDGYRFYQDHIHQATFEDELDKAGFRIVESHPYSVFGGIVRDYPLGRWLGARSFFWWRNARMVKRACQKAPRFLAKQYCHMMMYIVR